MNILEKFVGRAKSVRVHARLRETKRGCPYVTVHGGWGIMSIVPMRGFNKSGMVHVYIRRVTDELHDNGHMDYQGTVNIRVIIECVLYFSRMKKRDLLSAWKWALEVHDESI